MSSSSTLRGCVSGTFRPTCLQAKPPQQQTGVLAGTKHISISAPGVLLEQTSAAELEVLPLWWQITV